MLKITILNRHSSPQLYKPYAICMTQDELKILVARSALIYVPENSIIGIGTGSTVNKFIEALSTVKNRITAAVSSSLATTERLKSIGITVLDANDVEELSVYIDGADEIDPRGNMIKGGGAALTREKIVASLAKKFICIADESKLVQTLGSFPLPVEIIPSAAHNIIRQFAKLGATATLRNKDENILVTDNGQYIIDVRGLSISDPLIMEQTINNWPGVITVGIFSLHKANTALIGAENGVRTIHYP
jgi:ribose 5-phosphate isomerase A